MKYLEPEIKFSKLVGANHLDLFPSYLARPRLVKVSDYLNKYRLNHHRSILGAEWLLPAKTSRKDPINAVEHHQRKV